MIVDKVIGLLVFITVYIIITIILSVKIRNELRGYKPTTSDNNVTLDENSDVIWEKSTEIGVFLGSMWPILIVFFLSLDLGNTIYKNYIYNGNDEDRIASWLF